MRGSCAFAARCAVVVCDCAGRSAWPLVPTVAERAVDVSERRALAVLDAVVVADGAAAGADVRFASGAVAAAGAAAVLLAVVDVLALDAAGAAGAAGGCVRFASALLAGAAAAGALVVVVLAVVVDAAAAWLSAAAWP